MGEVGIERKGELEERREGMIRKDFFLLIHKATKRFFSDLSKIFGEKMHLICIIHEN